VAARDRASGAGRPGWVVGTGSLVGVASVGDGAAGWVADRPAGDGDGAGRLGRGQARGRRRRGGRLGRGQARGR